MQQIVPNIWFNGNAEEAGEFYAEVFDDASFSIEGRYPETGLPDFQRGLEGQALVVGVTIGEARLALINAGDTYAPNPSISFMLNFDPLAFGGDAAAARERLTRLHERLIEGGSELMPLQSYPFSPHYAWVQDRYGVNWQLILTNPEGEPRPFLMPALMFCGPAQNRATEMVDLYCSLFADSEMGTRSHYAEQTGPATTDSVQFSDFRIGNQWFVAMDSGYEHAFTFTPGVSLSVPCRNQEEIDRLWDALSSVPEAEQCGWLVDRAGVSWQIVPENMGELMAKPGAFEHMMQMKKLVIADF